MNVDAHTLLLLSYHPMLISTHLEDKVIHLSRKNRASIQMRDSIIDALALVDQIDKALGSKVRRLIRFYVALKDPEQAFTHNSFTCSSLIGTVFLSASYQVDKLAEAIVHEFHHNELNMVTELEELWIQTEPPELFYSPWRSDARPLGGLFHGIYVFFGVIRLYSTAEQRPELGLQHAQWCERRRELCYQVRTAVAQVRDDLLTDTGRSVIAWVREGLSKHAEKLGLNRSLPARQHDHLRNWQRQNPDLSASVNLSWTEQPKSVASGCLKRVRLPA